MKSLAHSMEHLRTTMPELKKNADGKVGYALLWLMGIPLPLLIIVYLIRGH